MPHLARQGLRAYCPNMYTVSFGEVVATFSMSCQWFSYKPNGPQRSKEMVQFTLAFPLFPTHLDPHSL